MSTLSTPTYKRTSQELKEIENKSRGVSIKSTDEEGSAPIKKVQGTIKFG